MDWTAARLFLLGTLGAFVVGSAIATAYYVGSGEPLLPAFTPAEPTAQDMQTGEPAAELPAAEAAGTPNEPAPAPSNEPPAPTPEAAASPPGSPVVPAPPAKPKVPSPPTAPPSPTPPSAPTLPAPPTIPASPPLPADPDVPIDLPGDDPDVPVEDPTLPLAEGLEIPIPEAMGPGVPLVGPLMDDAAVPVEPPAAVADAMAPSLVEEPMPVTAPNVPAPVTRPAPNVPVPATPLPRLAVPPSAEPARSR